MNEAGDSDKETRRRRSCHTTVVCAASEWRIPSAGGWLKLLLTFACDDDHKPSGPRTTSMLPLVFELTAILALLAVGFVFGRMWEMRQEIRRRSRELDNAGFRIPTANLPTI